MTVNACNILQSIVLFTTICSGVYVIFLIQKIILRHDTQFNQVILDIIISILFIVSLITNIVINYCKYFIITTQPPSLPVVVPIFDFKIYKKKYGKNITINSDINCTICLDTITKFETKKHFCFKSCNHIYHLSCIKKWLEDEYTCPNCRKEYP